jgi:serpin B
MASVLPQEALGLADMEKKQQQLLTPIDAGISPLQLANALWMQKDKSLVIGFQNLIEDMFEGKIKIRGVDFKGNTEGARVTINNWAAKQTSGKISELLKPEILKKETQLVVTNAIYFRGDWALGFDKKKTQKQPFSTGPDGKTQVNVPFMTQVNTFKYLQNEKMQVLELPYKGGFDMVILLPNAQDGLTAIESSWLDPLQQAQLKPKMVQVFLPKFKIEAGAELKETLMVLGMPTVFTNEADLSGLTGNQDLSLAEVVHKTMVSVDEIGTEAIAATAAIVSSRGMGKPEAEFKANRPFIFLIRHQATNTILFVGKLTNPTPN